MNTNETALYSDVTGQRVEIGDRVTSFRGQQATVLGWEAPRHSGSTGRVYVSVIDEVGIGERQYFPGVYDLTIVRIPTQLHTVGWKIRNDWLAENADDPRYDPARSLADNEYRCWDCGFISESGSEAERAHDELCDVELDADVVFAEPMITVYGLDID